MSTQNLISAKLEQQVKQEVLQQLTDIKTKLDFLITMLPEDVRSLSKVGNSFAPFLDKAYYAVTAHPEIMPAVFNMEEFVKDYTLIKEMTPVLNQIVELANCVQYTMLAAKSDAMNGALEIYAAVKQNQIKVLGLNVVADEMSVFFQRPCRKITTELKPSVNQ